MNKLERILYIEDDPDIQEIVAFVLVNMGGFTVHCCSSGEAAVREAAAFAPDLLLLDVMMPGMDGPATLTALRAQPECASIPAVFLTAKAQPSNIAQLKSLGVLDVITKPFDVPTLGNRLLELWNKMAAPTQD